MLYWTDRGSQTIERAYLDGSNHQIIQSDVSQPQGIAVDPVRGKVYWAETASFAIHRSNLDGSNPEIFLDLPLFVPVGLNIDPNARTLYWTDPVQNSISRIHLDSEISFTLLSDLNQPQDIVIDREGKAIFWTENSSGISTAALNGSNPATYPVDIPGSVQVLAIDTFNRRLVWHAADRFTSAPLSAGCDEEYVREVGDIKGARIDPASQTLYFTDFKSGSIFSAKPRQKETRVITELSQPWRIAIGPESVPPTISTHPQSQLVNTLSDVQLSVAATGAETLFYHWTLSGAPLTDDTTYSGVHSATLTIHEFTSEQTGAYQCVVTNPAGSAVSHPAIISLNESCNFDANGDGIIDVNDLSTILFHLGKTCKPVSPIHTE